ncbi:hypothetical protein Pvag_pPag10143 (plasmid) [Pantoea vagans C9-1]|nr:hypothetical protein Pvag_pPag10143 [Pantoea vagans C9-1]
MRNVPKAGKMLFVFLINKPAKIISAQEDDVYLTAF